MSKAETGRRGAGVNRSGATDTTMLIWKTIEANPGITRDEIFAKIEHQIPAGWAKRRYLHHQSRSYGAKPIAPDNLDVRRARSFMLGAALGDMRKCGSVARDAGDGYRTLRPIRLYKGNAEHVDETGTKAAQHLNAAYALPVVENFIARTEDLGPRGKSRPTAKEWAAIKLVAKAYRAV